MEPIPTRLRASTPGLGEASNAEIEQRAQELALCDGREAFSAEDLLTAQEELGGGIVSVTAPEILHERQDLAVWDSPVGQAGRQVRHPSVDDEVNIGEQLVQAGMAEAEHDQRVQAADAVNED